MPLNTTMSMDADSINQHMRLINFVLSLTGLGFNFLLIIFFYFINRGQCATYFLLSLMAICDFLYCTVYASIMLTDYQCLNLINHQIMCPLSFFLTPFAFTGSILLLLICLLHFLTNFVRRYDTILGQIGGRLSVVFILAFIIIRGVLSTTSVELIIPDPALPQVKMCTIVVNITTLVETVQTFHHILTEVTDIIVYVGWIMILFIYCINLLPWKRFCRLNQSEPDLSPIDRPISFAYSSTSNMNHPRLSSVAMPIELSNLSNNLNEALMPMSKERHSDVSYIIVSISLISILLYLPIMISKYSTIYYVCHKVNLLYDEQSYFLRAIQQTAHLFCLSIRFLPYLIFDKHIHRFLHQIIGMKCMKIERRRTLSRQARYRFRQRYILHFQFHRRRNILRFNNEDS